jgi:hypothetical protein
VRKKRITTIFIKIRIGGEASEGNGRIPAIAQRRIFPYIVPKDVSRAAIL